MLMVRVFAVLTACVIYAEAKKNIDLFLVPEELPTILNIIYSRLPPIKLGSDRRFGLGFRLGRNADAQFLVELGPQSETQALGDNPSKREDRRGKYLGGRTTTTTTTTTEDPAWNDVDSNTDRRETNEVNTEGPALDTERGEPESDSEGTSGRPSGSSRAVGEQDQAQTLLNTFIKWLSSFFHQR